MEQAALLLKFLRSEAAGGGLLIMASLAALVWSNSACAPAYFRTLAWAPIQGGLSVQGIVNDGLMALFFLLAGLEIRREMTHGRLATLRGIAGPGIAALGGMLVPAGIYLALTHGYPAAVRGWAVPVATDIAFSLAVLRLLGDRARLSLRIFLTALAIIDDLGAIIVIAVFYSRGLAWPYLAAAMAICMSLLLLRRAHVHNLAVYILCGCALWLVVFGSGVHATLSGVALAFLVPESVAERLEAKLSSVVAYVVLPLFGLANAGLDFSNIYAAGLLSPAPLGVMSGLLIGKQIGVFGAAVIGRRLGLLTLPGEMGMRELYGCAVLCGIGFTMSLFIGDLAFHSSPIYNDVKLAVFCASLVSALFGAGILVRVKT